MFFSNNTNNMAKKTYQIAEDKTQIVQESITTYNPAKTAFKKKSAAYNGLNPSQLHFLQMLTYIKTDEALMELKRLIRDFYAQQLQKEADKCWSEGIIDDQVLNEHLRTPYR